MRMSCFGPLFCRKTPSERKGTKGSNWRKSLSFKGSSTLTMELRKKIVTFRDVMDLPTCTASSPINQLVMRLMLDLQKLYPEIVSRRRLSELKGAPTEKILASLCNALKSIGDSWMTNYDRLDKLRYDIPSVQENVNWEKRVEAVLATLQCLIKMVKDKSDLMEKDEQKGNSSLRVSSFGRFLDETDSESHTSSCSSPITPSSVLPEMIDSGSPKSQRRSNPSHKSPLLWTLRVQAVGKLNPIDVKHLSLNLSNNGASDRSTILVDEPSRTSVSSPEKLSEEENRCSSSTGEDIAEVINPGLNDVGITTRAPETLTVDTAKLSTTSSNLTTSAPVPPLPKLKSHLIAHQTSPPPPPSPPKLQPSIAATPPPSPPQTLTPLKASQPLPVPPSLPTLQPNVAAPPPPPPALPQLNEAPAAQPLPPPPKAPGSTKGAPSPPLPREPGSKAACPPPPPPMQLANRAGPPPPPPIGRPANGAGPPPPPPLGGRSLLAKKSNSKLKRSTQMGSLYRTLKGKLEGSSLHSKSLAGKKGRTGNNAAGGKGMADALAEMTRKSAYFQQIEEDVRKHSKDIMDLRTTLSSFQTKDMNELLAFHRKVESILEHLTDETQVLSRFEGFPIQKLETMRSATALHSKLNAMITELHNWKIEAPLGPLLDKTERYFAKIKGEVDKLERTKDEETKKFKSQNIHFDFNILIRVKEAMVDVSSGCMELALKERREAKANGEAQKTGTKTDKKQLKICVKMLWRAFQFAFKVYTFAGGHDERADMLTRELATEIQSDNHHH